MTLGPAASILAAGVCQGGVWPVCVCVCKSTSEKGDRSRPDTYTRTRDARRPHSFIHTAKWPPKDARHKRCPEEPTAHPCSCHQEIKNRRRGRARRPTNNPYTPVPLGVCDRPIIASCKNERTRHGPRIESPGVRSTARGFSQKQGRGPFFAPENGKLCTSGFRAPPRGGLLGMRTLLREKKATTSRRRPHLARTFLSPQNLHGRKNREPTTRERRGADGRGMRCIGCSSMQHGYWPCFVSISIDSDPCLAQFTFQPRN